MFNILPEFEKMRSNAKNNLLLDKFEEGSEGAQQVFSNMMERTQELPRDVSGPLIVKMWDVMTQYFQDIKVPDVFFEQLVRISIRQKQCAGKHRMVRLS